MIKKIDIKISEIEASLNKDLDYYHQLERGIKALTEVMAQKRGAISVLQELKEEISLSKEKDKIIKKGE